MHAICCSASVHAAIHPLHPPMDRILDTRLWKHYLSQAGLIVFFIVGLSKKKNHGMTSVHSLIVKLTMRQECIPVGCIPPASMAIPCLLGEVPAGHGGCLRGGEVSTCWGVCLVGVSAWQGGYLPNRGAAYKGRSVWWWVLPGGGMSAWQAVSTWWGVVYNTQTQRQTPTPCEQNHRQVYRTLK